MNEYVIFTDSACDFPAQLAKSLGVEAAPLVVTLDGKSYRNYLDESEITFSECYRLLREGKPAITSACNAADFLSMFEPALQAGKDILYIAFSSGLSGTYNAGVLALDELQQKYPDRRIYAIDSLCASLGQGLLVYLAVQQQRAGKSLEEVRDYVLATIPHLCMWFTVDDLHHLRRGGRLSATSAMLGTMLSIKPVLHVDDAGHLIFMEKIRGRKGAMKRLIEKMEELAIDPAQQTIFISHGDCLDEAELLGEMIKEKLGVKEVIIGYVGPVIGAHAGPGVIALFFLGQRR
ncbi:MAG: DegV family protein [Christensenellaceae bacterium]|jgi:DegV family protein with EDD domain|nr:DegV family protein [Christensenellaceae bacterium]